MRRHALWLAGLLLVPLVACSADPEPAPEADAPTETPAVTDAPSDRHQSRRPSPENE